MQLLRNKWQVLKRLKAIISLHPYNLHLLLLYKYGIWNNSYVESC